MGLLAGRLEEIAGSLKSQFDALARDLCKLPDSKEFKELKKELEKLRKKLEKLGREDELKPIETKMNRITWI